MALILCCYVRAGETGNHKLLGYTEPGYFRHYLKVTPHLSGNFYGRHAVISDNWIGYSFDLKDKSLTADRAVSVSIWHFLNKYSRTWDFHSDNNLRLSPPVPGGKMTSESYEDYDYMNKKDEKTLLTRRQNNFSYLIKTSNHLTRFFFGKWRAGGKIWFSVNHTPFSPQEQIKKQINFSTSESDSGEVYYNSTYQLSKTNKESKNLIYNAYTALSAGYGRIENVTTASAALNIIDKINELEGVNRTLTSAQIRNLGTYIEKRRTRRGFLDSRQANIHDMESLISFLDQAGIPASSGARLVLETSDLWQVRHNQPRYFGWYVYAYPFAGLDVTKKRGQTYSKEGSIVLASHDSTLSKRVLENMANYGNSPVDTGFYIENWGGKLKAGLGVRARYRRPIKRFFQFGASALATWQINHKESINIKAEGLQKPNRKKIDSLKTGFYYFDTEVILNSFIFWYPNTRTTLSLNMNTEYKQRSNNKGTYGYEELQHLDYKNSTWNIWLTMGCGYFMSHKLNLKGSVSFRYDRDNSPEKQINMALTQRHLHENTHFRIVYNLGFEYFIF